LYLGLEILQLFITFLGFANGASFENRQPNPAQKAK